MASITTRIVMVALSVAMLWLVVCAACAVLDGRAADIELKAPFAVLSIHVDAARPENEAEARRNLGGRPSAACTRHGGVTPGFDPS